MDVEQLAQIVQDQVDVDAGGGGRLLAHETEVAMGNLDAVADLAGDAPQPVLDHLHVLALQPFGFAHALVDDLDEPGNDGQRAVDVVDDAGVNLAAGAGDFLLELLVVQLDLQSGQLLVVGPDFVGEGMPLHGGGDGFADGGDVEGLVEVIAGAQAQGLPDGVHRFVSGEHDDFNRGLDGLEFFQHLGAAHAGHADVQHGRVDFMLAGQFQGVQAVGGEQEGVIVLENNTQGLPRPLLVIHDEQGAARLVG